MRRGRWLRPNDSAGARQLLAVTPSLPRAELSRLTAWMIDRLDEIDGDPDLEDPHDAEQEQCHE